jgi:hypothetical protein
MEYTPRGMYTAMLVLHSLLRWVVLGTGIYAVSRATGGWLSKRDWSPSDARAGLFFSIAIDTQVLVGVLLYVFFSPLTKFALGHMSAAMREHTLRFYTVEHAFLGVAAIAAVHIARARAKRSTGLARHRVAAIGFLTAFVLILLMIPWPFLAYGRPLVRFS